MTHPLRRTRALPFSRRSFLRGACLHAAGGALVALPLMDSLRAEDRAAPPPKRLVLLYNPNGTVEKDWWPEAGASESDFTLGRIHAPLAPHRERLLIFRGVHSHVAQRSDNNGGPHQRGIGALFTGQMLQTGDFVDGCGSRAGWADGVSIDQAVADVIGLDTPFKSLELGIRASDNDVQGRIAYAGPGKPLPPMNDPKQVFRRLFALATEPPSDPIDPSDPLDARHSVLDTVREQFALLRPQLSQEDRSKLDAHLELVRDLERRLAAGRPDRCVPPAEPPSLEPGSELDMPRVSRAHLDLLAVAFACDLTRVASLQYSTGFNRIRYPWVDSLGEGHSLSHSGPSNTAAWEELTRRAIWHAEELAYFLDRLAAIPEGDGSVLDNTLVLWGNEVCQGNTHSLDNIPYLLVGDAGGALRSGRYLQYDDASNCDLLLSVLHALGIEAETFGHPDHCTGPLSGLLA